MNAISSQANYEPGDVPGASVRNKLLIPCKPMAWGRSPPETNKE